MIEGQLIKFSDLPSKGYTYPADIEIYVRPMTIKEEISSSVERFETSKAIYYESLLDNIVIKGNFDKNKLLFNDIQLIDLVRRLYTFDLDETISVKDYCCDKCNKPIKINFKLHEVEFTDLSEDCFNKEYTFSSGLTVKVSPIEMGDFIKICRKYLTNVKMINDVPDISNYVMAYYATSVVEVVDREFENRDTMFKFIYNYFLDLYKNKDKRTLTDELDRNITATVVPFTVECKNCSNTVEVYLDNRMTFCSELS